MGPCRCTGRRISGAIFRRRRRLTTKGGTTMNRTIELSMIGNTMLATLMLLAQVSVAYAGDKECWAEFFQDSQYSGKHFRLQGPIQLENLQDVGGENWESRISSLKVGPKARLTVFENNNFQLTLKAMEKYPELLRSLGLTEKDAMEDKELIFIANSNIHDLSDFNFRKKVRSLKLDCSK
jgi:hypothetical protein